MFLFGQKEDTCVRIPLDVKGRLFCSPMPFGPYDPGNALLKIYKQRKILSKNGIRKAVGEPYIQVIHLSSGEKFDLTITSADIEIFNQHKDEALQLIKKSISPTREILPA